MSTHKKIFILLYWLASGFYAMGQRSYQFDSADKLFREGKDFFELKNYAGCIDKLEAYKKTASKKDLIQEADFMLAYIAFDQGKEDALNMLLSYLDKYPDARHGDEACLLTGTCLFEREDYINAEKWFLDADIDALSIEQQEALIYRLAYTQLQNEKLNFARINFMKVLQYDALYFQASNYYIAYIDYARGEYETAMSGFKRLRRDPEYGIQANYYMAQIHYIENNHDEVLKLSERLLRLYPENENRTELYRIAGNSYYQLGNQDKTISMLRKYISSTDTPTRGELYLLGICEYNRDNYTNAIDALSQTTTEEDELTQNANLYIGQSYLELNDKNKARMAFEHAGAMAFNKKSQETALYNYAILIYETSFTGFGESVTLFENFLNDFPDSKHADKIYDYLVEVYLTSKNYDAALESINKIRNPNTKILQAKQNILFQLGNQAFMDMRMKDAIHYFDQAIALGNYDNKARSDAYFWRGESFYKTENYTKAVSDFNMYQSLSRQNTSQAYSLAYYNLGYCYFKLQRFDQSIIAFRRYLTLEKNNNAQSFADAYNRIGDCLFYSRQFAEAEKNYSRAASLQPSSSDYAIYQKGFVLGLQKDYQGKVRMMNRLINEYPQSQYIDEALFERGRSYVLLKKYNDAASSFNTLMDHHAQSSFAPKAGIQLGLLYYNSNQLERSIDAYKRVVKTYPGSEEAKMAVQDLKSVYLDMNDISSYAAFVNSLGGNMQVKASEQDSLTFFAAEKLFTKGNPEAAQKSMTSYLRLYPNGAFSTNANFYLAKIAFDRKDYTQAKRLFTLVFNSGDTKLREEALARKAEIEYMQKDYASAINSFKALQDIAETRSNREAAKLGIMRCAQYTGQEAEALKAADGLLKSKQLSPEIESEARYLRAKSYIKAGEKNKALKDLTVLSKDTRTEHGAEAKYRIAQLLYEQKETARAEKVLTNFIEKGTAHKYWLARSFILLADIYIDKGDDFQARQYLTSLKRNYKEREDINRMIENRLEKLKNK